MIDFSKELIYYEFFAFYSLEGILWYIEFFVHIVNFHSIMKMNCLDHFDFASIFGYLNDNFVISCVRVEGRLFVFISR